MRAQAAVMLINGIACALKVFILRTWSECHANSPKHNHSRLKQSFGSCLGNIFFNRKDAEKTNAPKTIEPSYSELLFGDLLFLVIPNYQIINRNTYQCNDKPRPSILTFINNQKNTE